MSGAPACRGLGEVTTPLATQAAPGALFPWPPRCAPRLPHGPQPPPALGEGASEGPGEAAWAGPVGVRGPGEAVPERRPERLLRTPRCCRPVREAARRQHPLAGSRKDLCRSKGDFPGWDRATQSLSCSGGGSRAVCGSDVMRVECNVRGFP